jgi:hypothetical protein
MSVVNPLIVEDEDREAVHPSFDGRYVSWSWRLTQINAFDLSEKVGAGRIDRADRYCHFLSFPCGMKAPGALHQLIRIRKRY